MEVDPLQFAVFDQETSRRVKLQLNRTGWVFLVDQEDLRVNVRFLLEIEWTLATTAGIVLADLVVEISGAAMLGYALILLLPFIGGAIGGCQSVSFSRSS